MADFPTMGELMDGVRSGKYIPYICDGVCWIPLDEKAAEDVLRKREEKLQALREALAQRKGEDDGRT